MTPSTSAAVRDLAAPLAGCRRRSRFALLRHWAVACGLRMISCGIEEHKCDDNRCRNQAKTKAQAHATIWHWGLLKRRLIGVASNVVVMIHGQLPPVDAKPNARCPLLVQVELPKLQAEPTVERQPNPVACAVLARVRRVGWPTVIEEGE
jgi:hypothetical protein